MAAPYRFLTLDEVLKILADLKLRAKRSRSSRLNLMIFRLSCCCGLRRGEMVALKLSDLILTGPKPCLRVRRETTKGKTITLPDGTTRTVRNARLVPLFWDAGTLADIRDWVERRKADGAGPNDPVLCGMSTVNRGKPLTGLLVAARWKTAIRCLGPERVRQLSVHCGRHSFCSLSRFAGHTGVEIRDAVGHTDERTTAIYTHAVEHANLPDVVAAPGP